MKSDVSALTMLIKEEDRKAAVQLCVAIEELDRSLRVTVKMASDKEQRLDELGRKHRVQQAQLKKAVERAEMAGTKLKSI